MTGLQSAAAHTGGPGQSVPGEEMPAASVDDEVLNASASVIPAKVGTLPGALENPAAEKARASVGSPARRKSTPSFPKTREEMAAPAITSSEDERSDRRTAQSTNQHRREEASRSRSRRVERAQRVTGSSGSLGPSRVADNWQRRVMEAR